MAHDANLSNAKLLITRDAEGRHHIGHITYKSEENLEQTHACPHHQHSRQPSPVPKVVKSARGTGSLSASSNYSKQPSPSTDQDYSSYSTTFSIGTNPTSASINGNRTYKTESVQEQRLQSRIIKDNYKENQPITKPSVKNSRSGIVESFIDNIDDYMTPTVDECDHDFDLSDIDDAMRNHNHEDDDDDRTHIDEDSLESCDGVIESFKRSISPSPRPIVSDTKPILSNVKPGGYCTALYLAQKQNQATNYHKVPSAFSYSRSNTVPNVIEALKTEEQMNKSYKKVTPTRIPSQRSKSGDLFDKNFINDTSKLDRDSGFDEHDFRCDRSHSSYDDNSSLSSIKSLKNSLVRSLSSDLNGQSYRENKASELRIKALDYTRTLNDQNLQDSRLYVRKSFNYPMTQMNNTVHPTSTTHKYRKNSQPNFYLKRQQL